MVGPLYPCIWPISGSESGSEDPQRTSWTELEKPWNMEHKCVPYDSPSNIWITLSHPSLLFFRFNVSDSFYFSLLGLFSDHPNPSSLNPLKLGCISPKAWCPEFHTVLFYHCSAFPVLACVVHCRTVDSSFIGGSSWEKKSEVLGKGFSGQELCPCCFVPSTDLWGHSKNSIKELISSLKSSVINMPFILDLL